MDGLGMQHEWDIREENIGFGGEREGMRHLWRSNAWIEISGGCCCHGNEILCFLNYVGISWPGVDLLTSKGELCCIKLITS